MRITVLTENVSDNPKLEAEHGLSLYIETNNHKLLFDMGQTDLFYENAQKLNLNLADIDIAVLSHGHYDHGGGLKRFLEINKKANVYVSKYAFEPHYNGEKYIGLDTTLKENERLVLTGDAFKIADKLTLFSCNKESKGWVVDSGGLSVMQGGVKIADPFLHEQYLHIEENGKNILISGCSHKGIQNIANHFKSDVVIGGFHTSKWDTQKLFALAQTLNESDIKFYTCHCTGYEQYKLISNRLKNINYISVGAVITV